MDKILQCRNAGMTINQLGLPIYYASAYLLDRLVDSDFGLTLNVRITYTTWRQDVLEVVVINRHIGTKI